MLFTFSPKNDKRRTPKPLKNRKPIRTDRLVRQHRVFFQSTPDSNSPWRNKKRTNLIFMGALLLFMGALILMLALPVFRVRTIQVESTDTFLSEQTKSVISEYLQGKMLRTIPKDNIWLIQRGKLSQHVLATLPGLETIHIEKHLPNNLKVHIIVRQPAFVWSSGGYYYYGDNTGLIFSEVRRNEIVDVALPFIYDSANAEVVIRSHVIKNTTLQYLGKITPKLQETYKLTITLIAVPSRLSPELDIYFSEGWYLRVSPLNDPAEQLKVLDKLLKDKIGAKRPRLAYIDLRTLDLVTYKFR